MAVSSSLPDTSGGPVSQPPLPNHIAVIMDGNGRWARARGLVRSEGHAAGAKSVRMLVEECRKHGIRYLTLFSFSTENWNRPANEVEFLMKLFEHHLRSELDLMRKNEIRLRVIGDLSKLPLSTRETVSEVTEATKHFTKMDLILAVSYGGREEILNACRTFAQGVVDGKWHPKEVDSALFQSFLYAPEVPDPELLIRTSDETRISNFLLWQLAYSELVVSKVMWPDFTAAEFARCLVEFAGRERRFGLTDQQVKNQQVKNQQVNLASETPTPSGENSANS